MSELDESQRKQRSEELQTSEPQELTLFEEVYEQEKEAGLERLKVPYTPIETVPGLVQAFHTITPVYNKIRASHGLPSIDFQTSDIRLIPRAIYQSPEFGFSGSGAALDRTTGVCYVNAQEEEMLPETTTMSYVYSSIHELGHRAADGGLGTYSRILNEGETDLSTQELLQNYVFPQDPNDEFYKRRQRYIEVNHPIRNGLALKTEDIVYAGDDYVLYYGYPVEIRIMKKIREQQPARYRFLQKALFTGDELFAGGVLAATYGPEMAGLFTRKEAGNQILATLEHPLNP